MGFLYNSKKQEGFLLPEEPDVPSETKVQTWRPRMWQSATWSGLSHTSGGGDKWAWSSYGVLLALQSLVDLSLLQTALHSSRSCILRLQFLPPVFNWLKPLNLGFHIRQVPSGLRSVSFLQLSSSWILKRCTNHLNLAIFITLTVSVIRRGKSKKLWENMLPYTSSATNRTLSPGTECKAPRWEAWAMRGLIWYSNIK